MKSKLAFINVGIEEWFCHGSARLEKSLAEHNFPGNTMIWRNQWPSNNFNKRNIYECKAAAFEQALLANYTTIIWGDASIYAIRDMQTFIDRINDKGIWIGQSGYNAAQTASDAQLAYFGVDRNSAEKMPDCATGLFGVNIDFPFARKFIETWIQSAKDGAFCGSRFHAGQSQDPRFCFCRQDQSAASVILGKMEVKLDNFSEFAAFRNDKYPSTFRCEGM